MTWSYYIKLMPWNRICLIPCFLEQVSKSLYWFSLARTHWKIANVIYPRSAPGLLILFAIYWLLKCLPLPYCFATQWYNVTRLSLSVKKSCQTFESSFCDPPWAWIIKKKVACSEKNLERKSLHKNKHLTGSDFLVKTWEKVVKFNRLKNFS